MKNYKQVLREGVICSVGIVIGFMYALILDDFNARKPTTEPFSSFDELYEESTSMPTLAAVAHGNDLVMTVPENITYVYEPKPDITVHELALILPVFLSSWGASMVEDLPFEAKRHFRREPPEKEDK